jgi:hypothetical protein
MHMADDGSLPITDRLVTLIPAGEVISLEQEQSEHPNKGGKRQISESMDRVLLSSPDNSATNTVAQG